MQENKRRNNVNEGTRNIKLNTLKASMFEFDENWAIENFVCFFPRRISISLLSLLLENIVFFLTNFSL